MATWCVHWTVLIEAADPAEAAAQARAVQLDPDTHRTQFEVFDSQHTVTDDRVCVVDTYTGHVTE